MPALNPDVAIVHVQRADENGNAHLWGIIGEQKEAAFAAKKVILTAEEIVDESVIQIRPEPHDDPSEYCGRCLPCPICLSSILCTGLL